MSQQTLYRKYRPRHFADVIGQENVVTTLQREIATGRIAHAYLFSGPRGIGKTTVARLLAKSLNCEKRTKDDACGDCAQCTLLGEGRHPDLIEIDAASNRGINEIRELRKTVRYAPTQGAYKVVIIDEVHMLTTEAFNALLKTLEEPPSFLVFILATTEIHAIPATIVSRTQRFDFKKVDAAAIVEYLAHLAKQEGITVAADVLERVALASEGCVRDAVSVLGQVLSLDDKKITAEMADIVLPRSNVDLVFSFLEDLLQKDAAALFAHIATLLDEGVQLERFSKDVLEVLRQVLLVQKGVASAHPYGKDEEKRLQAIAASLRAEDTARLLDIFMRAYRAFADAPLYQLPLELAICEWVDDAQKFVVDAATTTQSVANKTKATPDALVQKPVSPVALSQTSAPNRGLKKEEVDASSEKVVAPAEVVRKDESSGDARLSKVHEVWSEFLHAVRLKDRSLPFILKVCRPTGEVDGRVTLSFRYKLHYERARQAATRRILEDTLSDIMGSRMIVDPSLDETLDLGTGSNTVEPKKPQELADAVLDTFGGELV